MCYSYYYYYYFNLQEFLVQSFDMDGVNISLLLQIQMVAVMGALMQFHLKEDVVKVLQTNGNKFQNKVYE